MTGAHLGAGSGRTEPFVPARLALLASPCPATNVVFNALRDAFGAFPVVLEPPVPRWQLVRRRARTLGLRTTAGQVLFSALVVPTLARRGRGRIADIAREGHLDLSPVCVQAHAVPSVNSDEARSLLRRLDPTVVVVSGTRIISRRTLGCVEATFVNLHAGITPQYRGVHGGYWALAEGRPDLVGSTVHIVDCGIDTGTILGQATCPTDRNDSFATYPYLQLAAGVPVLVSTVRELLGGRTPPALPPLSAGGDSRLRTHPTLWRYLAVRWRRAVR